MLTRRELLGLFAALLLAVGPVIAEEHPDVRSVTVEPLQQSLFPQPGQGAWRERIQLIWIGETGRLERRRIQVFDAFADMDLDFQWEPVDTADLDDGAISGEGVLTWFKPGGARYQRENIEAQYRGHMLNGRPSGPGVFVAKTGARYDGTWKHGLMNGAGLLTTPDGDSYHGEFRGGRFHGAGVAIAATGAVYDGGFSEGARNGEGAILHPDGTRYSSYWNAGAEIIARRTGQAPAPEFLHKVQSVPAPEGLAIAVSVGGQAQFCCVGGRTPLRYTSASLSDRLEIFPDAPRLLAVWRGKENVVIQDPTDFDWTRAGLDAYSFLNYSENSHEFTLPLRFGLENRRASDVDVIGGYLDISRSRVDMQPAMQSLVLKPLSPQNIEFSIENYGWSEARKARLDFQFVNRRTGVALPPQSIEIGTVSSIDEFSFAPALAAQGVRIPQLREIGAGCGREVAAGDCLNNAIARGVFGGIVDIIDYQLNESSPSSRTWVTATGNLKFSWTDADGRTHETSAPFEGEIPLITFNSLGECEGGDYMQVAGGRPFLLEETADRYRIPFPLNQRVSNGQISRWEILLDATKSSNHDIRIVLQLADGTEVVSRDISILFFRPNTYPASLRPFEPRC